MKKLKFLGLILAVYGAGMIHIVYADDASTNTTTTTSPPPGAAGQGQDINSNTTATITPPPNSSGDINSNTTTTTAPPPGAAADINSNTTTTTTPPPPTTYNDANTTTTTMTTTSTTPAPGSNESPDYVKTERLYRDMEFDLDTFGTLALGRQTIAHISEQRIYHNSQLGLGAGGTFFFCRYVGIGGEAYAANTTGSFVDSTSGSIYVRCPIEKIHMAPYAFGGGGYDFEGIKQGFGQAGIGLDIRIVKYVGVFADARYVFAAESHDYGVGRAGIRIAF